jgi:hypothetical protein
MRKATIYLFVLVIVLAITATAQMADRAEIQSIKKDYLGLNPVSKPFSLIDMSRLKFSHSYSVSFFSGGGSSGSLGMYTGTIFYEISPSLSLDIALGIAHNPGSLFGQEAPTDARFFPAAELNYHPSERFRLSIGFVSHPGFYNNPYYPGNRNFWR